ncbi:hypothetical protein [Rhizobium terrae]|uniref:hypothetical protein n=1 Tax=Rhizobium terrae TaxID=2171756 RepID=UPI000E3E079F|nr:hypothetical protein [Rhizobium terrae]
MFKIISVSLISLGLATGAIAQTASSPSTQSDSGDPTNKVNPGPMRGPQATDDTTTNSIRTNCAPNQQTDKTSNMPDKTATTNVTPGTSGSNTNGQSSDC